MLKEIKHPRECKKYLESNTYAVCDCEQCLLDEKTLLEFKNNYPHIAPRR